MKKTIGIVSLAAALFACTAGVALATPSTQIWIPSTDIQPFGVGHLNIDNYFRASGVGKQFGDPSVRDPNILDIGPTVGILPYEKIQAEIGFDYLVMASEPNDNHPLMANFKIGTPEDSLCKYSPALAFGMYNIGPAQPAGNAPFVTSGQNIIYGLAAKTIPAMGSVPSLGRISVGGYGGSAKALVDARLDPDRSSNTGLLLSWDRTMNEVSDKLWMGVDFMSGHNVNSGVSFGASWSFAKNVSVIFGYSVWKEKLLAGNNTFTTQLDINFP